MSEFNAYFQLGFYHIVDFAAFDHMLFLVALCAMFRPGEWRQLLILITAFTIGHSLTLALATTGMVKIDSSIIELLIPVTILFTALHNVFRAEDSLNSNTDKWLNYLLVLFFGLIHGMGFSGYLRALLGDEENILLPLFSFNLGVELGQIVIVAVIMLVAYVAISRFRFKHREWNLFLSGAAAGVSLLLIYNNWIW